MSDHAPKLLKFIVISMGFVIVGGFLFVGAVVAQRMSEEEAPPTSNFETSCSEITLPAVAGASWNFTDNEWHMHSQDELRRYDVCGTLIQRAALTLEK
jgi:hypothetical protein